jgi:hypothetical protein
MSDEKKPQGKYPGYSNFQIMDRPDEWRSDGWDLLEILPETKISRGDGGWDSHAGKNVWEHEPIVLSTTRFLFGLNEESRLFELSREIDDLKKTISDANQEMFRLGEVVVQTEKQLEAQKAETANAQRDALNHKNNAKKAQDEMVSAKVERKLAQAHLEKVTAHYGQATINKIINPPKPQKGNDPANRKVAL